VSYRTAEEAKNDNIAKMGKELGELYSALWQHITLLHANWHEYVELFGTKPSRVELLNKAAHAFFGTIQDELWDTTLLAIARLTDPASTFGKANLSIQADRVP
jgi:hypothetical protein